MESYAATDGGRRGGRIEALVELVLQIVVEFVLQLVAELAAEFGLEAIARAAGRTRSQHPAVAMLIYAMLGAAVGGLSLLAFPCLFIRVPAWQAANIVVTPFLAGLVMALVGRLRARHDGPRTWLSSFVSGYAFALGMAIVRYRGAQAM